MRRHFLARSAVSVSSLLLLAACGGTSAGDTINQAASAASAQATASRDLAGQPTLPKATVTRAKPAPSTVEGTCPYVPTSMVMDTIGQHLTRTTVISTVPHPGCAFYRPDSALAAQITVTDLANPIAAQNSALAKTGKDANPVTGIGDYGVVAIVDDGALLAVTKGPTLVVIKINQQSSLEAKLIAKAVVAAL